VIKEILLGLKDHNIEFAYEARVALTNTDPTIWSACPAKLLTQEYNTCQESYEPVTVSIQ